MEIKTNFSPYPAQLKVINGILDRPTKHHVIVSGRQAGKSLMILNLSFKFTLEKRNIVTMVVSPVFSQSKKLYVEMIKSIGKSGAVLIESNNAQDLVINFRNGSTMHFVSGEAYDNLRGYTVDYLFIDEAAFQRKSLWNEILKPMTLVKGKKVCFFSTPRGINNWFKEIYDIGIDPTNLEWAAYTIRTNENPYIPQSEIDAAKKLLPRDIYLSEYEGLFTSSTSGVFDNLDLVTILETFPEKPNPGTKYYAGLDLAIASDFTVLTVMDDKGNLVFWLRVNGTSWEQIIDEVTEAISFWKCKTYVELNNIGSVVYEQLRKRVGSLVEPFTTTNKSKNDLIETLKLKISEAEITLPSKEAWPELSYELDTFSYKILPSGLLSYSGKIHGGKDDTVMSLAMTVKAYTDNVGKRKFAFPSR